MHITYKIFTERNEEENTQHTSQQRADEYLGESNCDFFRISFL